ncbi:MAG: hypothetical protein ACM3SY_20935 [Candidatus Omnitrophota bacterium]
MPANLPIISLPVIVAILVFFIMIAIPFLIAFLELARPKDNRPLHIDMFHLKDAFYFGKSFKKLIESNIGNIEFIDTRGLIRLSKRETIELASARTFTRKAKVNNLLFIAGNLNSEEKVIFSKEIYVKGECRIGPQNVVRALYGEKDIRVNPYGKIARWICGEGNIAIGAHCLLGRSVAAQGRLVIDNHCRFQSLSGQPIMTVNGMPPLSLSDGISCDGFEYPEHQPVKREPAWKIFRKHVSVNCPVEALYPKSQPRRPLLDGKQWRVTDSQVRILPDAVIHENFVSRKNLYIGANCTIHGAVKSFQGIHIGPNAIIHGSVFAEGDIHIGNNCILLGNVFSQSGIRIGNGVKISRPDTIKSVIGKKRIQLGLNTLIFGYLLTEGIGVVRG